MPVVTYVVVGRLAGVAAEQACTRHGACRVARCLARVDGVRRPGPLASVTGRYLFTLLCDWTRRNLYSPTVADFCAYSTNTSNDLLYDDSLFFMEVN